MIKLLVSNTEVLPVPVAAMLESVRVRGDEDCAESEVPKILDPLDLGPPSNLDIIGVRRPLLLAPLLMRLSATKAARPREKVLPSDPEKDEARAEAL